MADVVFNPDVHAKASPCRKCGSTIRYKKYYGASKQGACVSCDRESRYRWAKRKAQRLGVDGQKRYKGKPCLKCGGVWRRTYDHGCIACNAEATRKCKNKRAGVNMDVVNKRRKLEESREEKSLDSDLYGY